jgi:uroporphyrinogen decarboxylase
MDARMTRRTFMGSLGLVAAAVAGTRGAPRVTASKREAMLSFRRGGAGPGYVPGAFFLHFGEQEHFGRAAVEKHLAFFRATGMDFVKIQYERAFPAQAGITAPGDWKKMPRYGLDFFRPQLEVVEGLVKAAGQDALVLVTLYSTFMCAGQAAGRAQLVRHIDQDGEAVRAGLDTISESLLGFIRECKNLGADGFYASTQGGEYRTFARDDSFAKYVVPQDLRLMQEIDRTFNFNILHVCDYEAPYADLSPFVQYPGDVVTCSPRLTTGEVSLRELARRFNRPIMGGMERKGTIATGTDVEIRGAVEHVLKTAPEKFILGADCTVPSESRWAGLRAAIETAHSFRRS